MIIRSSASLSIVLLALCTACGASVAEPDPTADDGSHSGTAGGGATAHGGGQGSGGAGTEPPVVEPTCDPMPLPDMTGCASTPIAVDLDQASANVAIVGKWLQCTEKDGGYFATGVAFFSDGRFKQLHESDGHIVCGAGFDEEGSWYLSDHSGIGNPDDYSIQLEWDGGGFMGGIPYFANDAELLRISTVTGDDPILRIP